jgi:hypothetical protein
MTPTFPVTTSVPLTMTRLSTSHDSLTRVACMSCDLSLDLHQPDPGFPDRLLGIYAGCQRWYIVDFVPGEDEAVMVLVPEARFFLKVGSPCLGWTS